MRALLLIAILSVLAIAGCVSSGGQQPPPASAPSHPSQPSVSVPQNATPENNTQPTCEEFCPTLAHIQCTGKWNVSGVYPGCVCKYECETATNTTAVQNATNLTQPLPATPTNATIAQMLNDGLDRLRSDFYKNNSGVFNEKSYSWMRIPGNTSAGEITLDSAPANEVKFNGTVISSVLASGFVVFQNNDDGSERAYGIAIFKDKGTMLDLFTWNDVFTLEILNPSIDKKLGDCWTYERDYSVNPQGDLLITYYFSCEKIITK
jgi:hypothetical protein